MGATRITTSRSTGEKKVQKFPAITATTSWKLSDASECCLRLRDNVLPVELVKH